MTEKLDVNYIIKELCELGIIDPTSKLTNQMDGTTDGLVYILTVNADPKYVLKLDSPNNISIVEQLHQHYIHNTLLPKLLYTKPDKSFILYTYIAGTTHYNRGSKINWLTLLIKELLNHYKKYHHTDKWGSWSEDPCHTWRDFIDQGVEYARMNVSSHLPSDDYHIVKSFVANLSTGEGNERFLLHGDCGVHNFVFEQNTLKGVIDPYPIVGPLLYDFLYAFCSSPDDLNLETLIPAYNMLKHEPMERSKLIEELIIQLYCRIGICLKHHPHDLGDYLKAWDYWKGLIR